MRLTVADRQFGQLALKNNLVSRDQIARCVAILENASQKEPLGRIMVQQGLLSTEQARHIQSLLQNQSQNAQGSGPGQRSGARPQNGGTSRPGSQAAEHQSGFRHQNQVVSPPPPVHASMGQRQGAGSGVNRAGGAATQGRPSEDVIMSHLLAMKGVATKEQIREAFAARQEGETMSIGQILIRQRILDVNTFMEIAQERKDRVVVCDRCGAFFIAQPKHAGREFGCKRCGLSLSVPQAAAQYAEGSGNGTASGAGARSGAARNDSRPPGPAASKPPAQADSGAGMGSGLRFGFEEELEEFGSYEIVEEIARGGMGIVYKARQKDLNRLVALKVMKEGGDASEKQIRRFKRETEAAAKLQHPNIVAVHEVGVYKDYHYFTMDLVEGKPLDEIISDGDLDIDERAEILEQICRAMDYAHNQGIIHRDLKPANIILDKLGHPKITDFGLAKSIDHQSVLTKTGAAVGTPYYMPPEQARGDAKAIDRRSDVYALGVIMYELLTGKVPFSGETTLEVYHKILDAEPRPPRKLNRKIDIDLDTICLKSIEKDIEKRYSTAGEFADDIRRYLDGEPILAKPTGFVGRILKRLRRSWPETLAAAAIGLVLIGGLALVGHQIYQKRLEDYRAEVRSDLEGFKNKVGVIINEAETDLNMGITDAKDHKYEEAIKKFRSARAQVDKLPELGEEVLSYEKENTEPAADHLEEQELNVLLRRLYFEEGHAHFALGTNSELEEALACYQSAIDADPDFTPAYYRKAVVLKTQGKPEEAAEVLTKAIQTDDGYDRAYLERGTVRDLLGRHADAIEDYSIVIERHASLITDIDPDDFGGVEDLPPEEKAKRELLLTALLRRGHSHLDLGNYSDAEIDFQRIIDVEYESFEAHLAMGLVHEARGDSEQAITEFREAMDIRFSRPEAYYYLGRHFFRLEKYIEAEKNLEKAIQRDEEFFKAHLLLGRVNQVQVEYEKAIAQFEQIVSSVRRSAREVMPEALMHLGILARLRGASEEALDYFADALDRTPGLYEAHLQRAILYLEMDNPDEAETDLRAVLQKAEKERRLNEALEARIENGLGRVAMVREDWEAAKDHFLNAQRLRPFYPEAAANMGAVSLETGQPDEARRHFEEALSYEKVDEGDRAPYFYREGLQLFRSAKQSAKPTDIRRSELFFRRAISINPRFAAAYQSLGDLFRYEGKIDRAYQSYEEATRVNPYHVKGYIARGFIDINERGDYEAANENFRRAIKFNPDAAKAYYGLGFSAAQQEEYREAIPHLTKAIQRDSEYREAYDLRAEIHRKLGQEEAAQQDELISEELERRAIAEAQRHFQEGNRLQQQKRFTDAVQEFTRAIELHPTFPDAYYQRGMAQIKIGKLIAAIIDFSRALELKPRYADEFYDKVYHVSFVMDLDRVMGEIDQLVTAHPDQSHIVFLRGFFYVAKVEFKKDREGDIDRGIADFNRTLELNPDHVTAYLYRGFLRSKKKQFERAHKNFAIVRKMDPDSAVVHFLEAATYSQEGMIDEAFEQLNHSFEKGFKGYDRVKNDPSFDNLRKDPRFKELLQDRR